MANIELDGANKKIKVDSGDLTLDIPGDIILDADGGDIVVADGGTNILKVTNSSSDVVLQPQVDAKDIIFKQYDGTTVATVEDNGTFNIPASKLAIGGTAVTSTAAELNILDGVTSTASELNLLDGGTSVGSSITVADADGFVVNDGGTMKTIPATDVKTYAGGGGMTLIAEVKEMSSSSGVSDIQFAQKFSSTYDFYRLVGYASSYDNAVSVRLRYMNNTTAYTGSDYRHLRNDETIDSSNNIADGSSGNFGEGFCVLADNTNQDNQNSPICMDIVFFDPKQNDSGQPMLVGNISWRDSNGKIHASTQACLYTDADTIDGFNIYCSSGNIRYYDLKLFGVHNA